MKNYFEGHRQRRTLHSLATSIVLAPILFVGNVVKCLQKPCVGESELELRRAKLCKNQK